MSNALRIGYGFHGFLGDKKYDRMKSVSTPDGNATYSWSIAWAAKQRGHRVIPMYPDRDDSGYYMHGPDLFGAFSQQKRHETYVDLKLERISHPSGPLMLWENPPELDVLLLEWRWMIPGRNCPSDKRTSAAQDDLRIQERLLWHYLGTSTKVILWDLDHKLDEASEVKWRPHAIIETSVRPITQTMSRIGVEPPFIMEDIMQHPTLEVDHDQLLSYIGSRYERDDVIDRWIRPVSERFPGRVHFHGNWSDPSSKERWPHVSMNGRIGVDGFRAAYGNAAAVPLLAKRDYMLNGFITPRPWEAVLFGSIPIGIGDHVGIGRYCSVHADDAISLGSWARSLADLSIKERHTMREELAHKLRFMDASHFVDVLESIA